MFIKSLELNNFKRFKELKLEFPTDITVIKGCNEQGKSSVVQAISVALFADPASSRKELQIMQKWGTEKGYLVKIGFEIDGEEYTLEKDFDKKTARLTHIASGEVIDDFKEITKKLRQFGGYQTPDLFYETACVKQGELALLHKKENIREALQDIVSTGGASISLASILKRIEKARGELRRGMEKGLAKNPGVLLRFKNDLDTARRELEEKNRFFAEEEKARHKLETLRQETDVLKKELNVKERAYENNFVYFQVRDSISKLSKEYDRVLDLARRAENAKRAYDEALEDVKELERFGTVDTKTLFAISEEIKHWEKKIIELDEEIRKMAQQGIEVKEVLSGPYIAISAVFIALGFLGFIIDAKFFLTWVFFGILSFWAAFSKAVFSRLSKKKILAEKERTQAKKEALARDLQEKLAPLQVANIEELEQRQEKLREAKGKVGELKARLEGLLGGKELMKVEGEKRELEKRIAIEDTKISEEQRVRPPTPEEQRALEGAREELRKVIQQKEREIAGLEAVLAHTRAPEESIAALEERVNMLEEGLERAQRREKTLLILQESLEEARHKTFTSTRETLQRYISEFLAEITEGKYTSVSLGHDMEIKVFSSEKGEEIAPEGNLSKGALEQLYLVARFALISLLYGDAARPVVALDDPFGNFDPQRKERTRHILKRLAQKFQILLFTCSNDYDKWGKVVELSSERSNAAVLKFRENI